MLKKVTASVAGFLPTAVEQSFFFGGLISITAGAWMVYKPLGPIVGGISAIVVSLLISYDRAVDEKKGR